MNLNKKITGGIFLVVIIFALCQGILLNSIISSAGKKEILAMRKDEMNKTKQKLKNYVEIAYNILESNYENSHDKEWLQKEYGLHLHKIIDIAESIVKKQIQRVVTGDVGRQEAQHLALNSISQLRYDADTGYVWINEAGHTFFKIANKSKLPQQIPSEMGMGYVWVNDIGKPYPKMLMHPTIPYLDGEILDDEKFNCALGIKKNLFVAMVEVVENAGGGFVDYVWPKPTKEGLTREMPKLSYVRTIPEWGWIIGTGIYVDDALDKAIEKSKQDLKKMRYDSGVGYFWINDKGSPYPRMIMHPTIPDMNGKIMDDPEYNVVLGEPKHLFRAITKAAKGKEGGYINYIWPKPTREGLTSEEPKLSYVRTFEPFGWIIGTGVYIDSIDRMIEDKIDTITSTNFYLLMTILSVAVFLFFFLTIASFLLIDRFFIRKINQANTDLQLEIEEKKRTEKELIIAKKHSEVANSAKSEFLANMSHEIRTPMNAVIGLTHLLNQTELNPQQKDYLSNITLSADNLLTIINDILDFSKIEAGKLELENTHFCLRSDILDNVTKVVELMAAEKGLEVTLDIPPNLPDQLLGDPVRLRQILINLLNNAVKFTQKGEITLVINSLKTNDGSLLFKFEVRDTGIGLTEDQLSTLFKAFSQADASTTRSFGGTGLGLIISKKLAQLMGGKIGATSVYGEGSIFWFTAGFTPGPESKKKEQPVISEDIRNLRVLVVDNNKTARMILSRQLEHFGCHVSEADSGEEAIYLLQSATAGSAFDLILLEWMMSGLDGIKTALHIQTVINLEKVPAIIMLTTKDKNAIEKVSKGVEIKEILTKPIFPSDLLNAILATFGKPVVKRKKSNNETLPDHVLGAQILLVEDNIINQKVAKAILEEAGFVVVIAKDGKQGLDTVIARNQSGFPVDAVLMDIQMPVMDGYTATKEIRKLPDFKDLPIIAMTANAFKRDRKKAFDSGMNEHVAKPINVMELYKVLRKLVHISKNRRSTPAAKKIETYENEIDFTALKKVETLDVVSGVSRVGGNRSLYKDLLKQFLDHHSNDIMEINRALHENDLSLAGRLAHTLKSVAGNIGAQNLYSYAENLEDAIMGAEYKNIKTKIPPVEKELSLLLKGLKKSYYDTKKEKENSTPVQSPKDIVSVVPVLNTLRGYLEEDDPEAIDYFLRNKGHLAQALPPVSMSRLEKKLRDFEFEAVQDELVQFLEYP